jgi:signal transduction histidine kinase/CheY-like chemotaxis protein
VSARQLLSIPIADEHDVVVARQRTRQIAALLGFDAHEQTRIATAVSAIARNAFDYAGGGAVDFLLEGEPPALFSVRVHDSGPGITDLAAVLEGRAASPSATGMGLGILGARRLLERFQIDSSTAGTDVLLGKPLPATARPFGDERVAQLVREIAAAPPEPPLTELKRQNQELLRTLEELHLRQAELARLNRELENTNRGVLALYAELDERADSLRLASELKSRFLSNMTHELRTPLNSILSISRLLLDQLDGPLTSEQQKQVHYVRRSAEDLSMLVNDLLDLARIEAGKTVVRPSPFTLAEMFSAMRGVMKPLLPGSEVQLYFDDATALPPLHTDEGKLTQIVRNLVANAIKFTEQGEIRVTAAAAPGGHLAISVSDTGIGIATADLGHIFEEFTQLDNGSGRRREGTGLGLSLCRRLAQVLGGTVSVRSTLGRGSTFTLLVPAAYQGGDGREVIVQPAPQSPSPSRDPTRLPVLVVDDDPDTIYLYERYCKRTPFTVMAAGTIDEARALVRRIRPAAIVLDVLLENESSWLFLTELKQGIDTRDLPVIVATVVDGRQTALALGADDFATKPVDRTWLLERLARLSGHDRGAPR